MLLTDESSHKVFEDKTLLNIFQVPNIFKFYILYINQIIYGYLAILKELALTDN